MVLFLVFCKFIASVFGTVINSSVPLPLKPVEQGNCANRILAQKRIRRGNTFFKTILFNYKILISKFKKKNRNLFFFLNF